MIINKLSILISLTLLIFVSFIFFNGNEEKEYLKDIYSEYFQIGTIWHGSIMGDPQRSPNPFLKKEKKLTAEEFNVITAENCMKPEFIQPTEGVFTFEESDRMIAFAESNNMTVIGHTLIWHHMTPKWFFQDKEGNPVKREILIERLRKHIVTVMNRYKGKVHYWDVVNEVIQTKKNEDGSYTAFYRETPWLKIIGPEYIEIAYKIAHETDPQAKLLYNDFNLDQDGKIDFALGLISDLRDKGIPIHGLGYQAHFLMKEPSLKNIEMVFQKCKQANIPIHITELDLSVLPNAWHLRGDIVSKKNKLSEEINPYPNYLPEEVASNQATRYKSIFKIFIKYKDILERVSFWGVWDGASWRDYSPISGRTDYPLFFNREFKRKPVYNLICKLVKENQD